MEDDIKILLTADIHLGDSGEKSGIGPAVRMGTFRRILSLARDHDVLMIAGDLFDSSQISGDLLMDVREELHELEESGTAVILVPGNGEMLGDEVDEVILTLPIQHIFTGDRDEEPWSMSKGEQHLYVYGLPVHKTGNAVLLRRSDAEGFHMGLFHVALDDKAEGQVLSLKTRELRSLPFDFNALGYLHHFRLFKVSDRLLAVYPGSPEGVEEDETGDRYVVSLTVRENRIHQFRRVSVNSMRIVNLCLDITDMKHADEIAARLKEHGSTRSVLFLELRGWRSFDLPAEAARLWGDGFGKLHLRDRSVPSLEYMMRRFGGENSLRGDFFSMLKAEIGENLDGPILEEITQQVWRIISECDRELEDYLCAL